MDLRALYREGHSIRQISSLTERSRNTMRRVLRESEPRLYLRPTRASLLDPFKDYLRERSAECALSAVRLVEEIRGMGYTGSVLSTGV